MEKILVDTSVIIDFLRSPEKQKSCFHQFFSPGKYQPVVSLTTITELWAGRSLEKPRTLNFVQNLIEKCEIISLDLRTAKMAGKILRQANYQISFQDAQIAALALDSGLTILTLNKKDFNKVKGLKLL